MKVIRKYLDLGLILFILFYSISFYIRTHGKQHDVRKGI